MLVFVSELLADTNGISVHLSIPLYPLLECEISAVSLSVTNGSNRALPIITGWGRAVGAQLSFEIEGIEFRHPHQPIFDFERSRPWASVSNQANRVLAPGEAYTWTDLYFLQQTCSNNGGSNIIAKILVGEGEWAFSPKTPINIYLPNDGKDHFMDTMQPCFETTGIDNLSNLPFDFKVFQVDLLGTNFLFTGLGDRICDVPTGITPSLQVTTNVLEVTFPETNRIVRFNINKGTLVP